ncbi:MAG: HAMP domain-containing protein, partial [Pseudomonadota bacterium]
MTGVLNKFKLTTKIYGSMGGILILLILLAAASAISIYAQTGTFSAYREAARTSVVAANINEDMLEAVNASLRYDISSDPALIDEGESNIAEILDEITSFEGFSTDADVLARMATIRDQVNAYRQKLTDFAALNEQRGDYSGNLDTLGNDLATVIQEIADGAFAASPVAGFQSGQVNEAMSTARAGVNAYFMDVSEENAQAVVTALADATTKHEILQDSLNGTALQGPGEVLSEQIVSFATTFEEVRLLNAEKASLKKNMDLLAQGTLADADRIGSDAIAYQDEIGPVASAQMQTMAMVILIVGVIAAVVGVAVALFMGRHISSGVRKTADATSTLAEGDTSVEIPGTDRGDELGDMARALEIFRDNAVKMQE